MCIFLLFLTFLFVGDCVGQNLVPNPSFEDYSQCPDNWGQLDRVDNWEIYKGSPDYFNSCDTISNFSTPQNFMGTQLPASGNAYVGLIFYSTGSTNADEIMGTQLTQSLVVGTKYFVSFKTVLKYNNPFGVCCANNKIGAKFSTQPFNLSNPPSINNVAHIWTDSVNSDTSNWTLIFDSYIADSTYNYLMVGNFFSNPNISVNYIIPINDFGYYFVDDICVSTDSLFCANYNYTGIIHNDNELFHINIYPNPTIDYFFIDKKFSQPYDLTIYNMIGQKIYEETNISKTINEINLTGFSNGVLLINIKTDIHTLIYKILKQ